MFCFTFPCLTFRVIHLTILQGEITCKTMGRGGGGGRLGYSSDRTIYQTSNFKTFLVPSESYPVDCCGSSISLGKLFGWARYSLGTTSFFCLNSPCIVVATPPLRSGNVCESLLFGSVKKPWITKNKQHDERSTGLRSMLLRLIIINKPNPNLGGSAPVTLERYLMSFLNTRSVLFLLSANYWKL